MIAATISDLLDECQSFGTNTPEYHEKQIHRVPDAKVVDRTKFLLERCKDQTLLSIGASGPIQDEIEKVCTKCYCIDKEPRGDGLVMDLDGTQWEVPFYDDVDFILCGEILEHLGNPGRLLGRLRDYAVPLVITVPNAHSHAGRQSYVKDGIENVNKDHVSWYSWKTLKTLVERYGFTVREFYWYNGKPLVAEGLIFVVS